MKNGIYQNHLGAQLTVTGMWMPPQNALGFPVGPQTLGDIFNASTPDSIFGKTEYLVTDKSLTACGYEFVEELS